MVGAWLLEMGGTRDIWMLKDDFWTVIGSLKEYAGYGSALKIGNYIYLVPGIEEDSNGLYPLQRIHLVSDEEISTAVIGHQEFYNYTPLLFEATADFCI